MIHFSYSLQLLEAVGALTSEESKKARSRTLAGAYQETVTEQDSMENDVAAALCPDDEDDITSDWDDDFDPSNDVSSAVLKVGYFLNHCTMVFVTHDLISCAKSLNMFDPPLSDVVIGSL